MPNVTSYGNLNRWVLLNLSLSICPYNLPRILWIVKKSLWGFSVHVLVIKRKYTMLSHLISGFHWKIMKKYTKSYIKDFFAFISKRVLPLLVPSLLTFNLAVIALKEDKSEILSKVALWWIDASRYLFQFSLTGVIGKI